MSAGAALARDAPPTLAGALAALDEAGIEWSLLRPVASLVEPAGDVDLLVAPVAVGRTESLLADRGFTLVPIPGRDVHAVARDEVAARFVWVHVQASLRLAGTEVPAAAILAAAVLERGVRRPGDGWLAAILLLRALVDRGELPERHRPALAGLARAGPELPPVLARAAADHGVDLEAALGDAAREDWRSLAARSVHRPAPPTPLWRRVARAAQRLARRRRWGISVAVIGPDGAGKSSLVAALARDLPLPVRVQYMGLTGGSLPRADALRVPGLVLAARLAILWLRYLRGLAHVARGGIVVFDRYTLDAAAPPGFHPGPLARISRRLQGRAVPLPDLVLLLDAAGETLHRRSGEYDAALLESWRRDFLRLERIVPQLVRLDAERPAEEVRRAAEGAVWRRYSELRGRAPGERV